MQCQLPQFPLGSAHVLTPCRAAVQVRGSVAYAAQDPWIRNASLRDNILMGLPFHQQRYSDCLEACALLQDLDLLPARDATEIGWPCCVP